MMHQIQHIVSYICIFQVIFQHFETLAAKVSMNQNITGLLGYNDTHLTCSFFLEKGEQIVSVQIIAKNITEDFFHKSPIAIFEPEKAARLLPSGTYLSGRVTLKDIKNISTNATLTFKKLKCIDEKDYMCRFFYYDKVEVITIRDSEATRISVKASPSRPEDISSIIVSSSKTEKYGNDSSEFIRNINDASSNTTRNELLTFQKYLIHTTMSTQLQTTVKPTKCREGDTMMFNCTGNIGKPPGKLVWQKIYPQQNEKRSIIHSKETIVTDELHEMCSFIGTTNLTVLISAKDLNTQFRCFEESQADSPGMYAYSPPLDVHFHVRDLTITKQPNKTHYDRNTAQIKLICKGSGNPEPTYRWFREENTTSILAWGNLYIIDDVKQNNSDVYICVAYNTIDGIDYHTNYSMKIDIGDEYWSSTESKSLEISTEYALFVIPILCVVVIGSLVVGKLYCNRQKRKKNNQSRCKQIHECLMSCYGSIVNRVYSPVAVNKNTITLAELENTNNASKESKSTSGESGEEKNLVTTVDINPKLEATSDFIYADPCDKIQFGHVSDKTDLDYNV